jgi:glycogen debranching enzyme
MNGSASQTLQKKRTREARLPKENHERDKRVLTTRTTSTVRSIAEAVVVKHENIFFLAPPGGEIPLTEGHGFGLYYHDCRYLNGYEMTVGGSHPEPLVSTAEGGTRAVFQLTTPDIYTPSGQVIPKETLGIKWDRVVDGGRCGLCDGITMQNFGAVPVEFTIALSFRAQFEDIFVIRGIESEKQGKLCRPRWKDGCLFFLYEGADRLYRSLSVHCSPQPQTTKGTTAEFRVTLPPGESAQIVVSLMIAESERRQAVLPSRQAHPDLETVERTLERSSEEWLTHETEVRSNSLVLDRVLRRSLLDLHVLKSSMKDEGFFSAGVPWFVALFGRDSLVTSLQTLAFDPDIAEGTLRLLARYQGRQEDEWRNNRYDGLVSHADESPCGLDRRSAAFHRPPTKRGAGAGVDEPVRGPER